MDAHRDAVMRLAHRVTTLHTDLPPSRRASDFDIISDALRGLSDDAADTASSTAAMLREADRLQLHFSSLLLRT